MTDQSYIFGLDIVVSLGQMYTPIQNVEFLMLTHSLLKNSLGTKWQSIFQASVIRYSLDQLNKYVSENMAVIVNNNLFLNKYYNVREKSNWDLKVDSVS